MEGAQRPASVSKANASLTFLRRDRLLLAVALAATVLLALSLRLYGLEWDAGFPSTPHPDERAILMKVAELSPPSLGQAAVFFDAENSPWNPRWFPYGSFPLYLLKAVQVIYSLSGTELHDLRVSGRMISALADVGTVVLVYLLGSRLYGRREGLLASALLALAVLHIQASHFYAVDTMLGFFTVASLFFLFRVAREGRLRDSLIAGTLIGLGLATKVSQAPIYIVFFTAHLLYAFSAVGGTGGLPVRASVRWRSAVQGLAAGVWVSVVVFVVAQPYTLLDWSRFLGDVTEQSEMVRRIRDYPYTRQYVDTAAYWYQVRQLATWGLGWPLGVVAWGGLLYASLRGMRPRYGLGYLAIGWGLPVALLLSSTSYLAIVVALGLASAALIATIPLRSPGSRLGVLLLSWVVPYFLITGAFEVKFLRYLIPITPVLVLFGARMLVALWDSVGKPAPALRPWMATGLVLLLGATGFYALSYEAVYSETHTALRTSEWLNAEAPEGALILREHWEEGVPGLEGYKIREMPLYDRDGPQKLDTLSDDLADADYIMFFSNRLYGTIPRLPERYPATAAYYRLLFSGGLGYELVNVETAYPRLAGISIVDDTFGRPNLPSPDGADLFGLSGLTLRIGFADESFSVYDHPVGMVFGNVERYDAETIRKAIEGEMPEGGFGGAANGPAAGLMMSAEDSKVQRQGGTWSEIIRDGSWTNRLPVLAWLLLVEGIALLALPLAFVLFRPLADRGFLFSKALGLLAVVLVVWLLASMQWLSFSIGSIGLAILLLAGSSAVALASCRRQLVDFVRRRWALLVVEEALFLVAFLSFVVVRMANPDLWHPILGGEKPMDLAYLNAVLRSSYMPPYDPWFSGGYINYYYWGQLIVATLTKATGIYPSVAFNLAIALFFAMTVAGSFSIVYNLAEGTMRGLGEGRRVRRSAVLAGVGGALFVTVLGNLDGAAQVVRGAWGVAFGSAPFGEFDFWRSSRMMPPDPPGFEITEFPFFTFLFADLHAHAMALPFTLLALGLALAVVLAAPRVRGQPHLSWYRWSAGDIARLVALGVAVGALRLINTWDFPTYTLVAVAAVALAAYLKNGGMGLPVLLEAGLKSTVIILVGYLVFLPFHLSYEPLFQGFSVLERTTNQTVLWQFLAINGLFVFIVGSFFIRGSASWLLAVSRVLVRRAAGLAEVTGGSFDDSARRRLVALRLSGIAVAMPLVAYAAYIIVSGWTGSTIPFLVLLEVAVLAVGLRAVRSDGGDGPQLAFVAVFVGVALALAIGLDIFRVQADIDRMNSVFKFYLQVWVLLALASAYLLWRMAHGAAAGAYRLAAWKKLWIAALAVLVLGASVYPVLGTQVRLRNRFYVLPPTLDGMAYMRDAVYGDPNGPIELSSDYEGIRWLQDHIQGSPVVLEGVTPLYRWGGRISVYTGLPTVMGWPWHQEQQRWQYRQAVIERFNDVNLIYGTTDASEALSLMRKYGVEYVYLGQLEQLYYPEAGLGKFDGELSEYLEEVYRNGDVRVYRVRQG